MNAVKAKVALYARVSTSDKHQDPEMQLRELRALCIQKDYEIVGEDIDRGISGSKTSRPELDRLMADAQNKMFDAVMVWRFDRFARSVSHLLKALEIFRGLGVEFISLSESIDTSTPVGKMIFTVLGAVGELERDILRERVKAGMKNAKAKGKQIGRKPAIIDSDAIQTMRSEGQTIRAIANQLGLSTGLVHKSLQIPA